MAFQIATSSSPRPLRIASIALALGMGLSCCAHGAPSSAKPDTPVLTAHDAGAAAKNNDAEQPQALPVGAGDAGFASVAARFLEGYLGLFPEYATERGDHRFDGRWSDPSDAGEQGQRRFILETENALRAITVDALGAEARVDRAILQNQLRLWTFSLDTLRRAESDPISFTSLISSGLDPLVTREFAPVAVRMADLEKRLAGLPTLVTAAKKRLKRPPRVFTETAIEQNKGLVALVRTGLAESIAKVPAQSASLETARKKALAALEGFQSFLEKELLPRSDADFRLGRDRFEKKLRFVLADDALSAGDLAREAESLLEESRQGMVEAARELWPTVAGTPMPTSATPDEQTALVREVLRKLAEDRSTNATIVADASALLADATRFVRDNDLVRVPEEPCRVIEMPEYRRGVAIAYCESSGPLEKTQETFYAIAPTPADWSPERSLSFYREYNKSMLADLTVHEAMPGHYLQAMHQNRFRSSVRSVFDDGAFVEGWAVYGEWVMARHGFGGPKVRMMRHKMTARVAANAILDFGIHGGTLTEQEALRLMMQRAYQEEGEATAKWKRARLTSAQLSTYFYGFHEMIRLRALAEKGANFRERSYHDALLSHGAPPMREIRRLLFAE